MLMYFSVIRAALGSADQTKTLMGYYVSIFAQAPI